MQRSGYLTVTAPLSKATEALSGVNGGAAAVNTSDSPGLGRETWVSSLFPYLKSGNTLHVLLTLYGYCESSGRK